MNTIWKIAALAGAAAMLYGCSAKENTETGRSGMQQGVSAVCTSSDDPEETGGVLQTVTVTADSENSPLNSEKITLEFIYSELGVEREDLEDVNFEESIAQMYGLPEEHVTVTYLEDRVKAEAVLDSEEAVREYYESAAWTDQSLYQNFSEYVSAIEEDGGMTCQ